VTEGPVIDARELEPPEPFVRVMRALESLAPGATLTVLLPREPFPLYAALDKLGYPHTASLDDDGTYTIRIRKPS
jgi:TusA-related sulfurtransferase